MYRSILKTSDERKVKKMNYTEFIELIYGMSVDQYYDLNEFQKEAIRIDYKERGYKGGVF